MLESDAAKLRAEAGEIAEEVESMAWTSLYDGWLSSSSDGGLWAATEWRILNGYLTTLSQSYEKIKVSIFHAPGSLMSSSYDKMLNGGFRQYIVSSLERKILGSKRMAKSSFSLYQLFVRIYL